MPQRWISPGKLGLGLFLLAFAVYLLGLRTNFGYDGQMMYRVTESLVLRQSFRVADPIWHMNEPYAYFGLGVSFLLLPFYALGFLLLHDGARLIVLYEPIVTALGVLAVYGLTRDLGASYRRSLAVSLVYAFATLAWYYSTTIFAEPLIASLLPAMVLGLRRYRATANNRWLLFVGSAAAVTVLARYDSALLVAAPFSLYALRAIIRQHPARRQRLKAAMLYLVPIGLALAVDLWYDWLRYGDPLNLGPRAQYGGVFSTPLPVGVFGLLFSPGAGLFIYVPLLALVVAAFPRFWQRWRAEAVVILVLFGLRLVVYGQWSYWDGREWGPRFLVPMLPLLIVVLIASASGLRWRLAGIALAASGVAIELLGQIVPFDTVVWPRTAPLVVSALHLQDATGSSCLCSPVVDQAASTAMDFNLRFSPLVQQVALLRRGIVDPSWLSGWPVFTLLLVLAGAAALGLLELARRLDRQLTLAPAAALSQMSKGAA